MEKWLREQTRICRKTARWQIDLQTRTDVAIKWIFYIFSLKLPGTKISKGTELRETSSFTAIIWQREEVCNWNPMENWGLTFGRDRQGTSLLYVRILRNKRETAKLVTSCGWASQAVIWRRLTSKDNTLQEANDLYQFCWTARHMGQGGKMQVLSALIVSLAWHLKLSSFLLLTVVPGSYSFWSCYLIAPNLTVHTLRVLDPPQSVKHSVRLTKSHNWPSLSGKVLQLQDLAILLHLVPGPTWRRN